jgi:general secretion pathway protein C
MIGKELTQHYYTLLQLIALTVVIYIGVDVFYKVIQSQLWQVEMRQVVVEEPSPASPPERASLRDFQVISDRNLFGSTEATSTSVKPEQIEALDPTTLQVALLGTVSGDERTAYAVIEETATGEQGLYRVGDGVQNAIIKMILRGRVVLRVGDKDEILTMEESASSRKEASSPTRGTRRIRQTSSRGSTVTVRQSEVQDSLQNMNELLSQVRIRPHFTDGQPDGLALTRIKPQSIFARMGLKSGDIVKGVNGSPIATPDDVLSLYESLKSGSQLSLQITRNGEAQTINYRIQ